MGLLDSAKNKITGIIGEETVDEVHYPKDHPQNSENSKNQTHPPTKPTAPKKSQATTKKSAKPENNKKTHNTKDNSGKLFQKPTRNRASSSTNVPNKPQHPNTQLQENKPQNGFHESDDSFTQQNNESDTFETASIEELMDSAHGKNRNKKTNTPEDILETLNIPTTYNIETDIFLPQDIDNIKFDLQTPYGYEQSQVNTFTQQTKTSIKRYIAILQERNTHVTQLATIIDKLQVNNNKLKYQQELANGINLMTSSETNTELENKNSELLITNNQLQQQIHNLQQQLQNNHSREDSSNPAPSNAQNTPQTTQHLHDHISTLEIENEQLRDENYTLKQQLAQMEENQLDQWNNSPQQPPSQASEHAFYTPESDTTFSDTQLPQNDYPQSQDNTNPNNEEIFDNIEYNNIEYESEDIQHPQDQNHNLQKPWNNQVNEDKELYSNGGEFYSNSNSDGSSQHEDYPMQQHNLPDIDFSEIYAPHTTNNNVSKTSAYSSEKAHSTEQDSDDALIQQIEQRRKQEQTQNTTQLPDIL